MDYKDPIGWKFKLLGKAEQNNFTIPFCFASFLVNDALAFGLIFEAN